MTITSEPTPTPSATGGSLGLTPEQMKALQGIIGSSGSTSGGTGQVFMGLFNGLKGKDTRNLSERAQANLLARGGTPNWMSEQDAENTYFNWTQKQRDDFRAKGLLSGLLTQGAGDLEAFNLWQNLVKQASLYGAQNQRVGPLDILSGYVKSNSNGGWIKQGNFEVNPATGERRYIGPKFTTATQSQVDMTDPATAKAVAVQAFQSLLGRDPGQGEIAAYAAALSQSEAQNPSQATVVSEHDPVTGDVVGTSSVSTGGMTDQGRLQLAEDEIKGKKEYGATQAATTYMGALMNAVKGS